MPNSCEWVAWRGVDVRGAIVHNSGFGIRRQSLCSRRLARAVIVAMVAMVAMVHPDTDVDRYSRW